MENVIRRSLKNDMLSQSYCEGIKKIVGSTGNSVLSFAVSPETLEHRKRYWNTLFDRYSEELSNETELMIDLPQPILQPVQEDDFEGFVEEYSPLRIPMRKPPSLIQHWVNTGTFLHHDQPDNHKSPATVPSANKQALLQQSVGKKKVRKSNRRDWKVNSGSLSSSSVDTAAYILSNANRTKKAEATAIVEGSRLQINMGAQQTKVAEQCPPVGTDEDAKHVSKEDLQDTPVKSIEHSHSDKSDSIVKSRHPISNLTETNMLHNTILTPDSIGPENNNAQFPNQNTLMETIEKALKCLTNNSVITPSQSDHDSIESSSLHEEQSSTTDSQDLAIDTSKIRRKKLYSGRDSPVDLINMRSSVSNRLSQVKEVLHPALDPIASTAQSSYLKKRKLQAIKRKQKWTSLFAKSMLNKTSQIDGSEDKNQVTGKSEELHNTTAKDTTKVKKRAVRKITSQKVRFTPKRVPTRRKLPTANLKESVIHLKRLTNEALQNYNSNSSLSSSSWMNPIVKLTKLPDSYIKKYVSRTRLKPIETDVSSTDKSLEFLENRRNSINKAVKTKSTKVMLPPNTQYIDSDESGSSRSTILFVNCLENDKNKRTVTTDSSSLTDSSSRDSLCKVDNVIPITKSLKKVDLKNRSRTKSNDSVDRLEQRGNSNLKNAKNNSQRKAKRSSRSDKSDTIECAKDEGPVVVLQRIPTEVPRVDERSEEISLPKTSKKTCKSLPATLNNSVRQEDRNVQAQPTKTKKSSDRQVFRTTLGQGHSSDYSDHSEISNTSSYSRTLRNNTEAINNKRNRAPLLTITSDEDDDLENLIQLLPRKRARSRASREKPQDATVNLTAIRLAQTLEILSDTTDDIDTVKKNRRKALQSKTTNTSKSEGSIADSKTHQENVKPTRRSKRIEKITPKKVKNGGRKSRRHTQYDKKKHDEEDTVKSTDRFISTEKSANHIIPRSRDVKVTSPESERRTHDTPRETLVNKKTQAVESSTEATRNNRNKYSANTECTRTKARCLRFQTRLFEESDSEYLPSSTYPRSVA